MSVNMNRVLLHSHAVYPLSGARPGDALACDEGVIWVTQAGDAGDYLLREGETISLKRKGKVIVQALGDSAFHVA